MLSPRFEGTPFPMLPPEAQSLYAYNIYTPIIYIIYTHTYIIILHENPTTRSLTPASIPVQAMFRAKY